MPLNRQTNTKGVNGKKRTLILKATVEISKIFFKKNQPNEFDTHKTYYMQKSQRIPARNLPRELM